MELKDKGGYAFGEDSGTTLRDYFAAKVLQGCIINKKIDEYTNSNHLRCAEWCYRVADVMLKARESYK